MSAALSRLGRLTLALVLLLAALGTTTRRGAGRDDHVGAALTGYRVYLLRDGQLGVARRDQVPADRAILDTAVDGLLFGPLPSERSAGLDSAIPPGTTLAAPVALDRASGVATVDLSPDFARDAAGQAAPAAAMAARMAQVVFTLTQFETVGALSFAVAGHPVPSVTGDGRLVTRPVGRGDYEALLPAILIEAPVPYAAIQAPLRVIGTARTDDATFLLRLYSRQNRLLAEVGVATVAGERVAFDATVPVTVAERTGATLLAFERATDGTMRNAVAIPLEVLPPPATPVPATPATPRANATLPPGATPLRRAIRRRKGYRRSCCS